MEAQGGPGSIVLMSSGAGRFPHPHLWAYGISKAGICFLAETAAEELGPLGIRVNAVAPGIIDDELMAFITAGGPAARRLPGPDAPRPGRAPSRTWPPPSAT